MSYLKTCSTCNEFLSHSERWDSYYCKVCNIWMEPGCTDPECYFQCYSRPERPLKIIPNSLSVGALSSQGDRVLPCWDREDETIL